MTLSEINSINSLRNFYEDSEIFITGGSGYIGKVLIEKLLRSCTRIKKIYLLLRTKKNKSLDERVKAIWDSMLFDTLRDGNPFAFEKLEVIEGDIGELNLGICQSDMDKLKACTIIFHSAATVRFDDPLKSAILLNTRGTREVCKLAQTMPHLKALIHVSTAYIQPKNFYVQEKIYPTDSHWETYIEYAENLDEDLLNFLTPKLTRFAPNTYTFTKHLAEKVVIDYKKNFNLPIAIFRPSIVSASESEPLSGWVDNFNGPMAIVLVGALGLNHVLECDGRHIMDVIPVDVCVKGMIVAAFSTWKKLQINEEEILVLNAASIKLASYNSMRIDLKTITKEAPSVNMFGIPHITYTNCVYYACLIRLFRNILPALFVDGILKIMGKKPILMKLQRILMNAENSVGYFFKHNFRFDNFNFIDLNLDIPTQEKDEFSVANKYIDNYRSFYINAIKTSRKVLLGESDSDEIIAKRRYPYIYTITRLINLIFIFICYKLIKLLTRLFFMM